MVDGAGNSASTPTGGISEPDRNVLVPQDGFGFNSNMLNTLPVFIGLRYIRSKRENGFVSFVSALSFGAMALGVMALIVVLSVMNGFDREIKERILNVTPHAVIEFPAGFSDWKVVAGQVLEVSGVEAAAPYTDGFGMLTSHRASQSLQITGIDPQYEAQVTRVGDYLVEGSFDHLKPGEFGVVIGSLAARNLGVSVGDTVQLTLPDYAITLAGVFARSKKLRVVGIFQVGAQVDENLAFLHLADAGRLYRTPGNVTGLRLKTSQPFHLEPLAEELQSRLDPALHFQSWDQSLETLFRAMKMEKVVVSMLLAVIIGVAAFNIVANLVLMVVDKRQEIAVLRTLGCGSFAVMAIFMVQGIIVGLFGIAIGSVLGILLALAIGDIVAFLEQLFGFYIFDPSVYFISHLPSQVRAEDVLGVVGFAALLSVLATFYPSWRAGKVQPAEALSYAH